jgi:transcriptional regulator with XRE-family HTH domain
MASLKKLLAINMKERRRILGISQATLAERVNTSTHYIAMIELERKTPSILMLERIAVALEMDPPELFSIRKVQNIELKNLKKSVLEDMEKAFNKVISEHINEFENNENFMNKTLNNCNN